MYVIAGIYICTLTLSANVMLIMLSLYYRFMITSLKCIFLTVKLVQNRLDFHDGVKITRSLLSKLLHQVSHILTSILFSLIICRKVKNHISYNIDMSAKILINYNQVLFL